MKALNDFYKKIEEVENWMNKTGIYGFLGNVKTGFEAIWKAVQPLWNYALKPMLDYALQNPWVLTTLFSIFLGNKLKNGIANIIGSGSTGLIGLHGWLGKLAMIGATVIIVKMAYDSVKAAYEEFKKLQEVYDYLKEQSELNASKNKEVHNSFIELYNASKLTKEQIKEYINVQLSYIGSNNSVLESMLKNIPWYNRLFGLTKSQKEALQQTIDEQRNYIDVLIEDYEANKMNTEQKEIFLKKLEEEIGFIHEANFHLSSNSEEYKKNRETVEFLTGKLENYNNALNQAKETIQRQIEKLEKENQTLDVNSEKYQVNQNKIEELRIKAEQLAQGDYSTAIKINADTTEIDNAKSIIGGFVMGNYVAKINVKSDTTEAKKGLTKFFSGMGSLGTGALSVLGMSGASIGSVISKINSFDVGTNYVPNDQLAMVHKGEMIIPAKYNPMTSNLRGGHDEEIIEAIYELKETLENKDMNAYISEDDIGRASSNYRNRRSRQLGKDVD